MTGLRKLHAFCTRDPGRGYPSRLEIQRELERLLAIEVESLKCPHAPRPGPCYRTEPCPAGFEYDTVRNVCGHVRGPSPMLAYTVTMALRENEAVREGDALMMVENKDGSVSAALIKNIGRE